MHATATAISDEREVTAEIQVESGNKNQSILTCDLSCDQSHVPNSLFYTSLKQPLAVLVRSDLADTDKRVDIPYVDMETEATRDQDSTNKRVDKNYHSRLSKALSDVKIEKSRSALLIVATLLAALTYWVQFQINKQDSTMLRYLVFFNSMVFIVSVGTTLFLLQDLPFKPWPQITMLGLFVSYMLAVKEVSPNEAMPLFLISIVFLLLALICRNLKSCVK
ncbi:uncharacterized protein LOC130782559 [Actinidia eriantha]|uniref:uncharacterized protein LOC130782559 n=1 Tax=Actinidia eriantha TaxID=165200 RepID=UPI00258CDA9D|nr:uncharacterized protein LOC130782559 [Actinidia eriantha]